MRRGGKLVYLGSFATAEEAALSVARAPEGQAAARRPAAAQGQGMLPAVPSGAILKEEGTVPPMPPGTFVKEEGAVSPMPPDSFVKVEAVVREEAGYEGLGLRGNRRSGYTSVDSPHCPLVRQTQDNTLEPEARVCQPDRWLSPVKAVINETATA